MWLIRLERGSEAYRGCLSIGQIELVWLWLAAKLELAIAKKMSTILVSRVVLDFQALGRI